VGRILASARKRGILVEAVPNYVSARRQPRQRPYAQRKPKDYQVHSPGDMVELDTLDLRPLPGVLLKHFTAHDVVCKWNVLGVYTQASAATTADFLDSLSARMPFPTRLMRHQPLQVDGGSEFESIFEEACQRRGIQLFVLPPRSPKLNGGVERAHRTHTEEFYEVTDSTFALADLRLELLEWETIYNTVRPHQALGYLTPALFLNQQRKEVGCH
jgi:transposase InsO family protein